VKCRRFSLLEIFAAVALLFSRTGSATADWIRDFRGEISYDDNLSNSDRESEQRGDFAFDGQAHFGRFVSNFSDDLRITVTADLDARAFARYQDFNRVLLGSFASLRYRFGLGAMAPFVRIEGGGGYANFEQNLQDGWRYRAAITIGKRLTERLALDASYVFEDIGGSIRLFDRRANSFALTAAFDLTEKTQLTAVYEFRDGEVVSYAIPERPDIAALSNVHQEVNTFGRIYEAYNLDANTNTLAFGISQALTQSVSVNVRYEWRETSRDQLSYISNILRVYIHASF
jgi:opacity protein-like surface antigen